MLFISYEVYKVTDNMHYNSLLLHAIGMRVVSMISIHWELCAFLFSDPQHMLWLRSKERGGIILSGTVNILSKCIDFTIGWIVKTNLGYLLSLMTKLNQFVVNRKIFSCTIRITNHLHKFIIQWLNDIKYFIEMKFGIRFN